MLGFAPRPKPLGGHCVGALRSRLPPAGPDSGPGLFAQVHYPADQTCRANGVAPFKWMRSEVVDELASNYGVGRRLLGLVLKGCRQLDESMAPAPADSGKWPIVVFSSGLFGSCEMYTQLCREMAASGAIVVAIEHEDGSGVYATSASTGEVIKYVKPPPPESGVDIPTFRHPFIEKHADELEIVTSALTAAARDESAAGISAEEQLLAQVLRLGDPQRLVLVGHSFGSSGIVRYMRRLMDSDTRCPYRGALLIDLWGGPLVEADVAQGLPIPFLSVLSEEWQESGVPRTQQLVSASGGKSLGVLAVRGTSHQWISESHYVAPQWLLRRLGIMGPGDFQAAHAASARLIAWAIRALCERASPSGFLQGLSSIDRGIVEVVTFDN